jgi:hypothetical protein
MLRMNAAKIVLGVILLAPLRAPAADALTLDSLYETAYRTNPGLAAEADRNYARALEIAESGFTRGTAREFDTALDRAAVLGHVDAADMKCTIRSNPVLGFAILREGYAWCHIAMAYFRDRNRESESRVTATWASVVDKLGPENRYLGEQYEQFTLRRMMDAARQKAK